jgi:hypothetical protein
MQNTHNEHYTEVTQTMTNTSYALKEAPNEQLWEEGKHLKALSSYSGAYQPQVSTSLSWNGYQDQHVHTTITTM